MYIAAYITLATLASLGSLALVLHAPVADVDTFMFPALGLREPIATLTHLVAACISLLGTSVLWDRSKGDRPKQVSMLIYGGSLVLLYCASAAYHAVDLPPSGLAVFRKLDHCAIFLLIAGTFTPFCFNAASGLFRLLSLSVIWGIAFAGIALKSTKIDVSAGISASLYIGMGWLALLGYTKLASVISHRAMMWAVFGGAIYSSGATIDVLGWPWSVEGVFGAHEVFHVLVMAASAVHYAVVLRYVIPVERRELWSAVTAT